MDERPKHARSGHALLLLVLGLAAAVGALTLGTLGGTVMSSVVPVAVVSA